MLSSLLQYVVITVALQPFGHPIPLSRDINIEVTPMATSLSRHNKSTVLASNPLSLDTIHQNSGTRTAQ